MNKLSVASFTNLGYLLHSIGQDPIESNLAGKTVVITGGTGGIGLSAASALARLGARVAVVGRDAEKLERVRSDTEGEIVTYQADLSLLSEVRDLAHRIRDREARLDVLVNNVGVLLPNRSETLEGLETTFAINLAGQFLLTNLLASMLVESAPSVVINVTSGGMYAEKIRPGDLQYESQPYRGASAYARTKRGQVILTEMWADRLQDSGVTVHSMHPGWARTAGVRTSLPTFNKMMSPFLRTPEQGADTIVWLAASPEARTTTGRLWFDRRPVPTHLTPATEESAQDRELLWSRLVEITKSDLEIIPTAAD